MKKVLVVRERLEKAGASADANDRKELAALNGELEKLQGENPLVRVCVDAGIVGDVISGWTGIPVGKMLRDDVSAALTLEDQLGSRVIGQSHALHIMSKRVRTSKAGIEDPNKPVGVFMLVGPSGVGKTETALAMSDLLYGGERNLITINMSEFQEAHTVSTLKGSPRAMSGMAKAGCSPRPSGGGLTRSFCSTRSRKPTRTCSSSSSRCLTRARWRMVRVGS